MRNEITRCMTQLDTTTKILRLRKRSIEFLGDTISFITGVPSAKDFRRHEMVLKKIIGLIENENKAGKLDELAIKINANHITKLSDDINNWHAQFNTEITNSLKSIDDIVHLWLINTKIDLTISKYCEQINEITRIVDNGKMNQATRAGYDPIKLSNEIRLLENNAEYVPLYSSFETNLYYQLPLSTVMVTKTDIWTNLHIPLRRVGERFIPYKLNTITAKAYEYMQLRYRLKANVFKSNYDEILLLLEDSLSSCSVLYKKTLCSTRVAKFKYSHDGKLKALWISDLNNLIYFWHPENTNASIICGNKKKVVVLNKLGKIQIENNCDLISDYANFKHINVAHVWTNETELELDEIKLSIEDASNYIDWHLNNVTINLIRNFSISTITNIDTLRTVNDAVHIRDSIDHDVHEMKLNKQIVVAVSATAVSLVCILMIGLIATICCMYKMRNIPPNVLG